MSLTNKDNVTDGLLYQLQQGKPLSEQDKRILASVLDQYGYKLQTKYGYTEQQAFAAIEKVKAGEAIVAPAADVATYNKARAYLINYGIQSGQAAVGTDALLALPGNLGTILRSTVAAGGAYQAGTGVGQLIEGQNVDGLINAGLGTAAIFGSVAANKVIGGAGAKTQAATKVINSSADIAPTLHPKGVELTYPDVISVKINLPTHLSTVEKYSQQKGISDGHNAEAFYSTASEKNVKIVAEKNTETKGVIEVQYQIPSYDREGRVTGYKDKLFTKTIYNPKIISDQKILDLGQQAASNGYKAAIAAGQREYTATAGGIKFQVYLDQKTGVVEIFSPVAK